MNLELPFTKNQIEGIAAKYPTPFYIYEEAGILRNAQALADAFEKANFDNFRNYYAAKALPNPHVLKILIDAGQGLDCSSLAELELAARLSQGGEQIMFTSNNTTLEEFKRASEFGAIINFDDISHIQPYLDNFGAPEIACCRYNPGNIGFSESDEFIIGTPAEAKYGMTKTQILQSYKLLKDAGVEKFGLHTMLLSNDLDYKNHLKIAETLFGLALEISQLVEVGS